MKVSLEDIRAAHERIRKVVRNTPIEPSSAAGRFLDTEVFLKCENLQLTGSFKIRGAYNKISTLTPEEKKRGVIASSAGNHAQGVALSSSKLGVKSTIVMPKNASIIKQMATKNYGADVVLYGEVYDDAYQHAREIEKQKGAVFIHPYEDPMVIAGQGTVGLEIFEAMPDVESVVVAIGGGGLISGTATALKALNPKIKVYGVVAENAPAVYGLFKKTVPPQAPSYLSIADGIAVKKPSEMMFESFLSRLVDDIVTVSEDEIAEAIAVLLERSKMVVEGSGAITLAAAFQKKLKLGAKTCLVLGGGNIDLNLVGEILDRGLSRNGRVARIEVVVDDRPGSLQKLTAIIAESAANILEVEHDRTDPSLHIRETRISFVLETKDANHIVQIRSALKGAGVRIIK